MAQSVVTKTRRAGHTITYSFLADRPGTFTYHERYGGAGLFDMKKREAGGRPCTDAGHGLFTVPRRDAAPAADGHAGRSVGIAVPLPWWHAGRSTGVASVETQIMANCSVIYYDPRGYGGDSPVQRLLRWSAAALADAAVWVSGICGRRDPDMPRRGDGVGLLNQRREAGGRACTDAGHGLFTVPRRDVGPAADGRAGRSAGIAVPLPRWPAGGRRCMACVEAMLMADCPVIYYDDTGYGGDSPVQRLLRWSVLVSGICGRRDPDMPRRGDGPLNVRCGGRANPHVLRAPYFSPP